MGDSYCILLWDSFGSGLVRVNPRLYTNGVDLYGNPNNDFTLGDWQLTDQELLALHGLEGTPHYHIMRTSDVLVSHLGDDAELAELEPVSMVLACPACHLRHVDEGDYTTTAHRSHACQGCGVIWKPALVPTIGVAFLPGCADDTAVYVPPDPPPPLNLGAVRLSPREFFWMMLAMMAIMAAVLLAKILG